MPAERILGAVLAGGQARRFGEDKALAELGGKTLLDHAVASLRPSCAIVIVCGRDEAPVPTLADVPRAGLGPLGGIAAALGHATANRFDAVLTTACDTPFLPDDLICDLLMAGPAYAAEAPTIGHWPVSLADGLAMHLAADGDRSIRRWAALVGARAVMPGRALANVNTPEDLAALR